MIDVAVAASWPLLGALVYRMRGGFPPKLPRPVDLALWSAMVTAPAALLMPWWATLAAFAACFGATSYGHGEGMDMGRAKARDLTEWANWPTKWVLGHQRDTPAYDTVYMAFNGVPMTLVLGGMLAWQVDPLLAGVALAGALKGPAYWLGWQVSDHVYRARHFSGAEWGEWLTGLFVAGAVAPLWLL